MIECYVHQRQTDKLTRKHTHTHTHTHTRTHTHTHAHTPTPTTTPTPTHTDTLSQNKPIMIEQSFSFHTDRQTGRQTDRQTGRQADRQTGRQAYIHTDRQTNRETDRQTRLGVYYIGLFQISLALGKRPHGPKIVAPFSSFAIPT